MNIMRIVLAIIATILSLSSIAQLKVAVYVTGDINQGYKKVIGSKLTSGITNSGDYAAVERTADFLAAISKEQDYQMSGVVNDKQIVQLGQQFGVHYVLVADITNVFESVFVSARMIDVETGMISKSTETDMTINSTQDLMKISEVIIKGLKLAPAVLEKIGPINSLTMLANTKIPYGYKICDISDIRKYTERGKKVSFPIITDIAKNRIYMDGDFYVTEYIEYFNINEYRNVCASEYSEEIKREHGINYCTIIESSDGYRTPGLGIDIDPLKSSPAYIYITKDE